VGDPKDCPESVRQAVHKAARTFGDGYLCGPDGWRPVVVRNGKPIIGRYRQTLESLRAELASHADRVE
jgi:hypothetical protein